MKIEYSGRGNFTVTGETRQDNALLSDLVDAAEDDGIELRIVSSAYSEGQTMSFTFGVVKSRNEKLKSER